MLEALLYLIAFVLFCVAAIPRVPRPFNFVAAGLAAWIAAEHVLSVVSGPVSR